MNRPDTALPGEYFTYQKRSCRCCWGSGEHPAPPANRPCPTCRGTGVEREEVALVDALLALGVYVASVEAREAA